MAQEVILVTGAAGFIGFHVASKLVSRGHQVIGIDNLNPYYDPALKHARLEELRRFASFTFIEADIADRRRMAELFSQYRFATVVHLAAQAGVRHSIDNPHAYIEANLEGFANVLEGCRRNGCDHLLYASSSSVYGYNSKVPFSVHDKADHPVSLYGATKKANELMAYSYSHLYRFRVTGLRFFTVYGPWGRPDMAIFLFTRAILEGKPVKLFNHGNMRRDFTYIDDVTRVVCRLIDQVPANSPLARVFNVGNNRPENLARVIALLGQELGRTAVTEMLPMQMGDVPETFADIDDLFHETGVKPQVELAVGIRHFVAWYRDHYKV